ncbi:MAG: type VI secretion system-associated FHA domain protein [bacterium]
MPVKLKVTLANQPSMEQEFLYHQDPITIGREKSNVLQLPDAVRKLVSRFHARIERNGEGFQLIDLDSRNHTFLNNQIVETGKAYPLRDGDRINIGGYILNFFVLRIPADDAPEPGVGLNPFLNEANELTRIFSRLGQKYALEEAMLRTENLQQALAEPLQELANSAVGEIIQEVLGLRSAVPAPPPESFDPQWPDLLSQLQELQDENEKLRRESRPLEQALVEPRMPDLETTATGSYASEPQYARLSRAFELLLETMVKLIQTPFKFVSEFEGRTIFQQAEVFKLYRSSAGDLHQQILASQVSEAKVNELLAQLKQAAENVITHQMALLEGYRACVEEGTRELLQRTDPEIIRRELGNQKLILGPISIPWRRLPFFFQWKIWQAYRNRHRELATEDRGVIEQRLFHRAFMKGYDKRIAAAPERSRPG